MASRKGASKAQPISIFLAQRSHYNEVTVITRSVNAPRLRTSSSPELQRKGEF